MALVLARYFIGMLVGGVAVLWVAAWYYLRKPRGAHTLHPVRGFMQTLAARLVLSSNVVVMHLPAAGFAGRI